MANTIINDTNLSDSRKFSKIMLAVDGSEHSMNTAENQTLITVTGPAVVTGFKAGIGTFKAIFTPDMQNKVVKDLVVTTDINGDNFQTNKSHGSEGPFKEKVVNSSLQVTS